MLQNAVDVEGNILRHGFERGAVAELFELTAGCEKILLQPGIAVDEF